MADTAVVVRFVNLSGVAVAWRKGAEDTRRGTSLSCLRFSRKSNKPLTEIGSPTTVTADRERSKNTCKDGEETFQVHTLEEQHRVDPAVHEGRPCQAQPVRILASPKLLIPASERFKVAGGTQNICNFYGAAATELTQLLQLLCLVFSHCTHRREVWQGCGLRKC